ncbi:unnamed protein product [Meloidogyne enterolobii]|uniref:Uncharacterized protein n=1 Tax=Meloidogyne enterolobii TaxID=390850 RepID=A0ACB0Y727_MELEN
MFRHSSRSGQSINKTRILKIPFCDVKSRDMFIRLFSQNKKNFPNLPHNVFVRRDLTRPELQLLYTLRKNAFNTNKFIGLYKYVVVDLSIKTLSNPKPFKVSMT